MQIKSRGFTLIETVLFIVVVSVAMAGIMLQINKGAEHSADALLRQKAIAYARLYFDQMQTTRWDEQTDGTRTGPGLDGGEACTLAQLDDFDDFDCFNGVNLGDGFSLDIDVHYDAGAWNGVAAGNHKRAVISVTSPIETLTFTLYRANYL